MSCRETGRGLAEMVAVGPTVSSHRWLGFQRLLRSVVTNAMATDLGARVRMAPFDFLDAETRRAGSDVLPRGLLAQGFQFNGRRVPLLGSQGIFKPAILPNMPLSITTVPLEEGDSPPYRDVIGHDGFLRYCYRETDPGHRDNVAELFEAAHIQPDRHLQGHPVVANGVALCKLRHAAFDADILGIRPDYEIEVRLDVLEEKDGPMLKHGLQGFHRQHLWTPTRPLLKPNPEFLEERYALFRRAH